ncbi:hypothetical protein CXR04_14855 [Streptomyces sp. CMB-StM0423]|nr:hypothetical protein CXR04_14855 [Streptomyces sp. CMB-StM0423]
MTGELGSLGELAARNGGVLVCAEALAAGWSSGVLVRRLRKEGWRKVRAGVWVEPGRVGDLRLRLRVAQAGRPELVVSHSAAAHLLGVEVLAVRPEFTHVRGRGRAPEGCVLHRTAVGDEEIVTVAGLRVTDAARTLVDLLRTAERDAALVAVESALTRRPLGPGGEWPRRWREQVADLHTVSEALAGIGQRRGVVQARQRLALVDPRSGSPAETIARLRMYDAGLRPLSQVPFTAPNGRRIRVDFFFPAAGLVVEIEGYGFHGSRAAHLADVERFNDLGRCPEVRRMLRFTAADVFERPQRMLHTIRAALGEIAAGESRGTAAAGGSRGAAAAGESRGAAVGAAAAATAAAHAVAGAAASAGAVVSAAAGASATAAA